jgi:hypothetical protein
MHDIASVWRRTLTLASVFALVVWLLVAAFERLWIG